MTASPPPLDPLDVARHAGPVRALALRLLRDSGAAEDAAQEAWLVAMRARRPPGGDLGAWVRGVLRNVARHSRREAATRRRHEGNVPPPRSVPSPDELVARTEAHHRVVGAVLALDEPYRSTIVGRYFEDLDAAEIARREGVPAATVRSRLKRALDLLRAHLDGEQRGDRRAWALLLLPIAQEAPARRARVGLAVAAIAGAAALAIVAALLFQDPRGAAGGEGSDRDLAQASADGGDAASAPRGSPRGATPPRARRPAEGAPVEESSGRAESPAVAAPPDAATAGTTGVSVEVVDESGARAREGTVELDLADVFQLARMDLEKFAKWADHLGVRPIAAANPVVVRDLPRDMDGLALRAIARVPGFPPTEPARFSVRAGEVAAVRLVAAPARTATVAVVDSRTDLPLAGASVVSTTEAGRRELAPRDLRGRSVPAAALTDATGTARVEGLGRGTHELECEAPGYLRRSVTWTDGEVRVRLVPVVEAGTVRVRILGPAGEAVPDVRVRFLDLDREGRTDAAGACEFEDVPAGNRSISAEVQDWVAARRSRRWKAEGEVLMASVEVSAGGSHAVTLGWLRGTASVRVRVADPHGLPVVGATVELNGPRRFEARTDGTGAATVEELPAGSYRPVVGVEDGAEWWFEEFDIADGARAERSLSLGGENVRGRVVDPSGRGVKGVRVYVAGPGTAFVDSGEDGRFVVRRARPGTYRIDADVSDGGGRLRGVEVPSEEEFVVRLAPFGRIVVRALPEDRARLREARFEVVRDDGTGEDGSGEDAWPLEPGTDDVGGDSPGLVPGRYEVVVTLGGRTSRHPVEVRPGETARVEVAAP